MISVHVLTKNSEATVRATFESLRDFTEIVVFDTGSTDGTLEITAEFENVTLHTGVLDGFGKTHNQAANLSKHDWILSIDSDEELTPLLSQEILALKLEPNTVYAIQRDNYFNGKKMRCCAGWHPDWTCRLYNRKKTAFSDDAVHEKVKTRGMRVVKLKHPLKHTPYRSVADFLEKMQAYSHLFALQNKGKKRSGIARALFSSLAAFCKSYILCRGFLGGREGLILSLYNAQTTYYKYLKLAEFNSTL